ncbi:MAG: aldose 1-epimerase family protein, partial [Planctomycetales bacterium]|nr:aldose 1-epimerase family protein [Planctomycetales bacterium]
QFVPTTEPGGLGWLGGFDELLVRCGLESNGGPVFDDRGKLVYGLHGKIANIPAHHLEVSIDGESGEIHVTGEVDESRLFHNKLRLRSTISARPGESAIRIVDEVTNLSAEPGELQLLYHVNFGAPLLQAGARVLAPVSEVIPLNARAAEDVETWDVYPAGSAGYAEQCYFYNLIGDGEDNTRVTLRNAAGTAGVSLRFNLGQLPCFTQWKNTQCQEDGYVTGLEPAVNLPNPRPFEEANGRVTTLAPRQQRRFDLTIEGHDGVESVAAAAEAVQMIAKGATPLVHPSPVSGWSPSA